MPLVIFILALAFFCIHLILSKKRRSTEHKSELLLIYLFFFLIGVQGFLSFLAHIFFAKQTALLIGWEAGSPFQFEVGIANLSFSIFGILALFFRKELWLSLIIGYSTWLWGDAIGHIRQWMIYKNSLEPNFSIYFYSDILTPFILIICYLFYLKSISSAHTWKGRLKHVFKSSD